MAKTPIPCIVLARPMDMQDPCLAKTDEGFVLPSVLDQLVKEGVISETMISFSRSVPSDCRAILESWPVGSASSREEAPQKRLLECMKAKGWSRVVILTSYSVFMDRSAIEEAVSMVANGEADAVFPEDVIAPKFFMVINLPTAIDLADKHSTQLPPFAFPEKVRGTPSIRLRSIRDLEPPWESFLWNLLYAGERNAIPPEVIEDFQNRFQGPQRLERESFRDFIAHMMQVSDAGLLDRKLGGMLKYESNLRLAKQVNRARTLQEHFPQRRLRALEIGHGRTPLTPLALSRCFDHVLGADPVKHSPQGVSDSRDFLRTMEAAGLSVLQGEGEGDDGSGKAEFLPCMAQELPLADSSVDFCFSHMVLEHVMDIEGLTDYLARVIRPGGIMVHDLGLQDHQDLSHINFEYLRHSREEWMAMERSTNLLRVSDFIDLFDASGFRTTVLKKDVRVVRSSALHPSWNGYREEDLYCYRALLKSERI